LQWGFALHTGGHFISKIIRIFISKFIRILRGVRIGVRANFIRTLIRGFIRGFIRGLIRGFIRGRAKVGRVRSSVMLSRVCGQGWAPISCLD
jgi:hypothetical protein